MKVSVKIDEDEDFWIFIGIIKLFIMALIQIEKGIVDQPVFLLRSGWPCLIGIFPYQKLDGKQDHDYGKLGRERRVSSLTDLILQSFVAR